MNPAPYEHLLSFQAPAILMLVSAVLIYTMAEKYSRIVDRIRELKSNKDEMMHHTAGETSSNKDLSNIEFQISHLLHRISMVRFAVFGYALSICFAITFVVLTGVRPISVSLTHYWITISFLFASMLSMAGATVLVVVETWKGYRVVKIEISETTGQKRSRVKSSRNED